MSIPVSITPTTTLRLPVVMFHACSARMSLPAVPGFPPKVEALTGVVESPHFRVARIVWDGRGFANEIRLRVDDVGPGAQCFDGLAGIGGIDFRDTQSFDNLERRADGFNRERDLPAGFLGYDLTA